ncbi:MAG: hypothetical protein AAB375_00500, partial [Patescibacteria group bacterium]
MMLRPKIIVRPLFIDELYAKSFGVHPAEKEPLRAVMEAIMKGWDSGVVCATSCERESAQIGLCQIGLHWHTTDNLSFCFRYGHLAGLFVGTLSE